MATVIRLQKRNHRIRVQHVSNNIRVKHITRRISINRVGRPGTPGQPGQEGPQGIGIPSGGNKGDILVKNEGDYQTSWASPINYSDKHYYAQFTTANQVRVDHNLGKRPAITIIDSANDEVEASIEYINNNQLWLRFTHTFSGTVLCN